MADETHGLSRIPVSRWFKTVESEGNYIGWTSIFFENPTCYVNDYCYLCSSYKIGRFTQEYSISLPHYRHNNPQPSMLSENEIAAIMEIHNCNHIVFGCGEFILEKGFRSIITGLIPHYEITIETSGRFRPELKRYLNLDVLIHLVANENTDDEVIKDLRTKDQIKVVVNRKKDLNLLKRIVDLDPTATIYAVPVPIDKVPDRYLNCGTVIKEEETINYVMKHYPNDCRVIIPQHMYIKGLL